MTLEKPAEDRFVLNRVYPEAAEIFTAVLAPLEEIKTTAAVVLDTNVLLVPYALSPKTLEEIGATYRKLVIEKRLVVPGQVAREFARHRANKLGELYQQLNDRKSKLPAGGIGKHPLLERLPEFAEVLQAEQKLLGASREYGEQLSRVAEKVRTWTWNDPVSELYRTTFTPEVVFDPRLDQQDVENDLKYRVSSAIPPGYKDASKPDGGVGDVVIWQTILRLAEERKVDVIFVSGEEKSDWWHRGGGRQLYPRFELVDEFRRRSAGKSFHIVSFAELLDTYGAADVSTSSIEEVRDATKREASERVVAEVRKAADVTESPFWRAQMADKHQGLLNVVAYEGNRRDAVLICGFCHQSDIQLQFYEGEGIPKLSEVLGLFHYWNCPAYEKGTAVHLIILGVNREPALFTWTPLPHQRL